MNIPGFVDLQVNGYKGVDFCAPDLSGEQFLWACEELRQAGTAAFLPTMITSPLSIYRRNLKIMYNTIRQHHLEQQVPGFHLEGPFISPEPGARGIHPSYLIQPPDIELLRKLQDFAGGKIKLTTIAAERSGAADFTEQASRMGIVVSLGHQLAGEEEINSLSKAGAQALTHLGNGMPNQVNRHHNPLLAGLSQEKLSAMIITDGHHLPTSLIKIIFRSRPPEKVIVTSDSSPLAGFSPGSYQSMGGKVVLEPSGRLYCPEKNCLAGSSATLLQCMNHLVSLDFISLENILKAGFYNPLKLIGHSIEGPKSGTGIIFDESRNAFIFN